MFAFFAQMQPFRNMRRRIIEPILRFFWAAPLQLARKSIRSNHGMRRTLGTSRENGTPRRTDITAGPKRRILTTGIAVNCGVGLEKSGQKLDVFQNRSPNA